MALNIKLIIANTLIELCAKKKLTKITISDIVESSGIARQTFYNHFKDKNDLIYWVFKGTLRGEKQTVETHGFFTYLCNLYTEATKKSHFLQQACQIEGQNSLSEAIFLQTYNYYKNYIIKHYGSDYIDDKMDHALIFNAYGASHLYVKWAMEGMPGDPKLQAKYAIHCMPDSIKNLLPLSAEEKNF